MQQFKLFGCALAAMLFCAPLANAQFVCTGDGNCQISINGLPQSCITAIELFTGPLSASTSTVQLAICDYKSLNGTCFNMELGGHENFCQVVEEEEQPGLYRYKAKMRPTATVPGYPGTFVAQNNLILRSVNLYPYHLGSNPTPVTYEVISDAIYVNGNGDRLAIARGSNTSMETVRPTTVCNLSGQCVIIINGVDTQIFPIIEIESEPLVQVQPGLQVAKVTAKQLQAGLGFEMRLDYERESNFVLRSLDFTTDFPAVVYADLNVVISYGGEEYRSSSNLLLQSANPVSEWPPAAGSAAYYVEEPVIFTSDSGNEIIVAKGKVVN